MSSHRRTPCPMFRSGVPRGTGSTPATAASLVPATLPSRRLTVTVKVFSLGTSERELRRSYPGGPECNGARGFHRERLGGRKGNDGYLHRRARARGST